jgi:enoyl-CoA hydratase/carnithine racemase
MTDQAVRVERSGPVTTVFLHRPARRNAVDGPTAALLAAAFRAFDADPGAAVAVLHGEGGVFCSGADLTALGTGRGNRVEPDGDAEGLDETAALASEFAHGRQALAREAGPGAARFTAGAGRHGSFGA